MPCRFRLKIWYSKECVGSTPSIGTTLLIHEPINEVADLSPGHDQKDPECQGRDASL
jgi:hypothetical protein